MSKTVRIDIIGAEGTPMRVLLTPAGELNPNFGLPATDENHDIVEFFDLRYPHTPDGQFTGGRYRLDTLTDDHDPRHGLTLDLGSPSWRVTADTLALVLKWADYHMSSGAFRT
jgi:hypothetical protein